MGAPISSMKYGIATAMLIVYFPCSSNQSQVTRTALMGISKSVYSTNNTVFCGHSLALAHLGVRVRLRVNGKKLFG